MSRHSKNFIPVRKSTRDKESLNQTIKVVEKGSTDAIKIHKDDIELTITKLRDNHDIELSNLTKDLEIEVKKLRGWAENFLNTETYEDFYRIIIKHFSDLDNIIPGTIGAFCYGCNDTESFKGVKSCAAMCIGSIPPPNIPDWADCDSNIRLLHLVNGSPVWKDLQIVGHNKLTYIFVLPSAGEDPKYVDISDNILREKGIKSYEIYTIYKKTYCHLRSGVINSHNIGSYLTMDAPKKGVRVGHDSALGIHVGMFFLFVLIIVILAKSLYRK